MANAILAALILLPVLLTIVLKSNAALSFLALCGAFVLITLGSADLKNLTGHVDLRIDSSTLNLILLIVPLLLTLLLRRKAFSGQLRKILQLIAALCAGGLLALVSVPLLNASSRADFANNQAWDNLQKIQTPIVAVGLVVSLGLLWLPKRSKDDKHKKHH